MLREAVPGEDQSEGGDSSTVHSSLLDELNDSGKRGTKASKKAEQKGKTRGKISKNFPETLKE